MKLKILVAPIIIVVIVAIIIWGIMPAYDGLKAKKAELKTDQNKLSDIQGKQRNVEALFKALGSSSDQQNILTAYLPQTRQEEDLIGNLNSLASDSGLFVYNLSVVPDQENPNALANSQDSQAGPIDVTGNAAVISQPVATNFSIKMGVAGDYEKIKNFLAKVEKLKRFNSVNKLNIGTVASSAGQSVVPSSGLKADAEINFNYLKKTDSIINFENPIFSAQSFDMSIIQSIVDKTSVDLSKVTVDTVGKINPFLAQ